MSESQNIEWKSNWHNDYLKWICGFANANGGSIFIGKNELTDSIFLVVDYQKKGNSIPIIKQAEEGYKTIVCRISVMIK